MYKKEQHQLPRITIENLAFLGGLYCLQNKTPHIKQRCEVLFPLEK